jgi:ParB family chromosome partitioning protein
MYLIDVRDMTDEECFRFADLENRERDDVSDYERAVDYRKAIDLYYGGVDSQMAERIGYTRANLSYLLKLAELPDEIIEAFGDPRQITVNNGRTLGPLLKETKTKRKVLAKAAEIAEQQKARVRDGGEFLDGKEVMRLLQASVKTKPRVAELKQYKNGSGVVVVQVDKDNAKEMKVTINRGKNISSGDVRAALGELINELP